MKKLLLSATFIATCLIFLSGTASARLLLCETTETGYKTYIDTDSISSRVDKEKGIVGISVRVVGIRPDGSTILDAVLRYIYEIQSGKLYMSDVTHNYDWREIDPKTQGKPFWWSIEYVTKTSEPSTQGNSKDPEKVYVCMNDYGDAEIYILPKTIRDISFKGYNGFSVQIWTSDGNSPKVPWYFVRKDGVWCQLLSLDEWAYPVPISKSRVLTKVVEVANRYR